MDLGHRRLSSKHSKTREGKEAESVQMYGEIFDHNIKDKQAKIFSKTTNDSPSSKDSSCGSGSSSDSERQIDVISIDENGKNKYCDTHINGTKSLSYSTRRSSYSSSPESSSNDFFGMEEAFKYTKSHEFILASKSRKDYVSSSGSSDKYEVDNNLLVPRSTYQVYNLSHSQKGMSPTASPPVQVMDRSGRYDASRVPSSVFEGNTNPSEWSIASNDSLFSIQLGQPSFSRENALMNGELGLSGELTKSNELSNRAPSVTEEETDTAIKSVVENLQTETSHGSFKLEGKGLSEAYNEIKTLHQTASYKSSKSTGSSLSDSSDTGMSPDTFPSKKRSRRLWYCYNCSRVFCHLWPSNKCSNCCGAFSCCWNYNRTKYHHHTSPILTETETNDSMKMDTPRQQSYKQESQVTSDSTASYCSCFQSKQESEVTSNSSCNYCNWFNCFSCPSCTWKLSCISCKCCC